LILASCERYLGVENGYNFTKFIQSLERLVRKYDELY